MITLDIPQANALDTVRRVIKVVAIGATSTESVADFTQFSSRHANYRIHAARILGLLHAEGDRLSITPRGERLLETEPYSSKERSLFFAAIESSAVIQILAPDLLTLCPPTRDELAERLFSNSKLSRETADRRANGLLTWRKYVLGQSVPAKPRATRVSKKPRNIEPDIARPGEQLTLF